MPDGIYEISGPFFSLWNICKSAFYMNFIFKHSITCIEVSKTLDSKLVFNTSQEQRQGLRYIYIYRICV